ncbi:hypothetical protein [Anabaena azotica]|uniref:hypothetical protein n=1 Tax=Anabaena azotica TaxID=197653 RepID=UPI001F556D53|nr:hypothetical protein [Anabaena azotica]
MATLLLHRLVETLIILGIQKLYLHPIRECYESQCYPIAIAVHPIAAIELYFRIVLPQSILILQIFIPFLEQDASL